MRSRFAHKKDEAITLRKGGESLPAISKLLEIPKSTLSEWFKKIELTKSQKENLHKRWLAALVIARKSAGAWHHKQKIDRLEVARSGAVEYLGRLDVKNKDEIELALAFLYLGEGTKRKVETAMGNSDPRILRFFVWCLRNIYKVDDSLIKCDLYLRADQDGKAMQKYWSKELLIDLENFKFVHYDQRTAGIQTYESYHGVCYVRCGTVAIQRRLVYISTLYCERIASIAQW